MRIVVVEDEYITRMGLVKQIGRLDLSYEVIGIAENGNEGIAIREQHQPDIVITDIKMPI